MKPPPNITSKSKGTVAVVTTPRRVIKEGRQPIIGDSAHFITVQTHRQAGYWPQAKKQTNDAAQPPTKAR